MQEHYDQRLPDLYDRFAHGLISRRQFIDRASRITAGGLSAAAILNALSPDYARANQVSPEDPAMEDVPAINAPLLIQLASLDARINEGWPAYEAALEAAGKTYTMHMYENANHGFHNDTTPRYDKDAAALAWQRTVEFFAKNLV